MASHTQVAIGQLLKGKKGSYCVVSLLHENIWVASTSSKFNVIVKQAVPQRLRNERQILTRFHGCQHIRQLVDEVESPLALILRHMDDTALAASKASKLTRRDVKYISRGLLEALKNLHDASLVHTRIGSLLTSIWETLTVLKDIKPDNILINHGSSSLSDDVADVELADCGDVFKVDTKIDPTNQAGKHGHAIGAAIFRSPEAMLNLEFGCATDIWSFGATVITLLAGKAYLIFRPKSAKVDDEDYPKQVMLRMINWFFYDDGASIGELMDEDRQRLLADLLVHAEENATRSPFHEIQWPDFTQEDVNFILKIMRFDPRNRLTAEQLLQDPWFEAD